MEVEGAWSPYIKNMKIELQSIPHLIASCLFLILATRTLLTIELNKNTNTNKWLASLFLVLALLLFDEFLFLNALIFNNSALWEKLITSLNLTIGPLTYFYAQAMTSNSENRRGYFYLHFLPAFTFFIVSLFISSEMFNNNSSVKVTFSLLFLATLLPYVFKVLADLSTYQQGVKQHFSSFLNHDLSWLKLWAGFMVIMAIIICLSPVAEQFKLLSQLMPDVHYLLIIASVVFLLMPDISKQKSIEDKPLEKQIQDLPGQELTAAFKHIEQLFIEQKSYLNNELTLAELSKLCQLPEVLVSNAINHVGKQCFYDYVNTHRIEEAKRLLIKHRSRSVIDVAMDSGFNAKSTFYNAFKKFVGQSPSEFRKANQNLNDECQA
ncbi:AraC family transcriptional regulator [Thalassotalea marina]|uniref:HTH araC/xylS-type domain-containing protein n=1 Tax=Thalassotalea marina TaxID=1673741 RepID=A0A919EP26_9GAMM|nr:AraC family transcriptional regulator [Thalassotalea marina]GHG08294.1 hypothetical protein GCM10017161_42610 [Thalassotalea marina]